MPPTASSRSRMFTSPAPAARSAGVMVEPDAVVGDVELPPRPSPRPAAPPPWLRPECLAAFCTASMQQKYRAASTGAGQPRHVLRASTVTGIALPRLRTAGPRRVPPRPAAAGRSRGTGTTASRWRHPPRRDLPGQHGSGAVRRADRRWLREPEVHGQRHEVLLGAVVDVALQTAPFGVLGLDEPLPRGPELVGAGQQLRAAVVELGPQRDQPQHQARPGRPAQRTSRSSTGVRARPGRSCRRSTPSTWSPCRTARARNAVVGRIDRLGPPGTAASARCRRLRATWRPGSAGRRRSATPAPNAPRFPAPAASPSAPAARRSRTARSPASGNVRSTSYGVAAPQPPWAAARSRARCTRANENATTVVATTDNAMLGESVRPITAPPPSTTTT